MKIQILDKTKKKRFIEDSGSGIKKVPELLIRSGLERIRAYSGDMTADEIMDLWKLLPIEAVGLYVGKEMINKHGVRETRLSIDALHLWQDQIKNNILTLTESQEEDWFKGKNIELKENQKIYEDKTFIAVKSHDEKDFIGTGKIGENKSTLFNFLPKERRRKSMVI